MVGGAGPRYEVVCKLAGGGMADLYLARATGLAGFERLVVVKRLSQELADDPQAIQALYDEARIVATLCHTNIVQVTDVEVLDGQVSIVMEFLHGHDVAQLLRRLHRTGERLPLDQAIGIAAAVCAGLHHAHERVDATGQPLEIVHRDVSPHNVFVTYDGTVKLVDFGIARAATRRNRTELGVIKGKPGYIAPEQLRGKRVDRRTDVWATGVLLYEMTTGTRPYGNDPAAMDQLVAVVTTDPPRPSSRVEDYPPALEAIVMRAMSRDIAARHPTAEALGAELDAFACAQQLDLSPFRLGALMGRVFATQLAAWEEAQHEGRSLADHVASRASRSFDAIAVEDAIPTSARPSPAASSERASPGARPSPAASSELSWPRRELLPLSSPGLEPPSRRLPRWAIAAIAVIAMPVAALAGVAVWGALASNRRAPPPAPILQPARAIVPLPLPVPAQPPPHVEQQQPPPPHVEQQQPQQPPHVEMPPVTVREEPPVAPGASEPPRAPAPPPKVRPRPKTRPRPTAAPPRAEPPRPTPEDDLDAPLPR